MFFTIRFIGLQYSPSTGTNKTTPLHVGTSYTNDIGFCSKRATCLIAWVGSLKPQTARAVSLSNPHQQQYTPFKIHCVLYIYTQSVAEKPSTV